MRCAIDDSMRASMQRESGMGVLAAVALTIAPVAAYQQAS